MLKVFFIRPERDESGKIRYTPFVDGRAYPIYRRTDTGDIIAGPRPPGSVYDAQEFFGSEAGCYQKGPDGRSLVCLLPDGIDWHMDANASNSGKPWVRTGRPEDGTLDVNPSIATSGYHGHLRNGQLIPC